MNGIKMTIALAVLLGGCSFPQEGFPQETVGDPDHYRPPHFAGAHITGGDGAAESDSSGVGEAEGDGTSGDELEPSSEAEGTDSLGPVESSSDSSGGGSSGGGDSSSESTGGAGPGPWEACDNAACSGDLFCAQAFSMTCGPASSCQICSPHCDSDDDCGDGAFCFDQLGYCMLSCVGGCPDGAVCIDDAEDFCSFPA